MVEQISLGELFDVAIASEKAARKIYLGFKHKFSPFPPVSEFWQTMADDEAEHARILARVRQGVLPADLETPVDARMAEKAQHMRDLDTHQIIHSVNTLDDAYKIAYDLEASEVNMVFNFLTIRFLSVAESSEIVSATVDLHLLRLAEFSRYFGDAEQCKAIPAGD